MAIVWQQPDSRSRNRPAIKTGILKDDQRLSVEEAPMLTIKYLPHFADHHHDNRAGYPLGNVLVALKNEENPGFYRYVKT